MSLELGLIAAFAIVGFGGAALAAGMIWLRARHSDRPHRRYDRA